MPFIDPLMHHAPNMLGESLNAASESPQALDVAKLVEGSEARAYRSLMHAVDDGQRQSLGIRVIAFGTATAVMASSITNTVNMNRVIGLGIEEPASEALLDSIAQIYGDARVPFGIEVSAMTRPPELTAWLKARGIRRGMPTALHYRPAAAPLAQSPVGLTVRRATWDERNIVAEICCRVFRMPAAAHALIAGTAQQAGWRQWLALADAQPVAAALSFVAQGVGWLGWDATLPEFRGRGAQSRLIVHRVNEAVTAGCRYVTTETAVGTPSERDASYRNYQKLGFALAYERMTYLALPRRPARQTPAD